MSAKLVEMARPWGRLHMQLQGQQLGLGVHADNPSTGEAETEGWTI